MKNAVLFEQNFESEFIEWATDVVSVGVSTQAAEKFNQFLIARIGGYMESPASSSGTRHHAYPGGMMVHSVEVFIQTCRTMASVVGWQDLRLDIRGLSRSDKANALVASMLHDFNKVQDMFGRPLYIPNILKKGERSTAKPFKRDPNFLSMSPPNNLPEGASEDEKVDWMAHNFATVMVNRWGNTLSEGWISAALVDSLHPGMLELFEEDVTQAIEIHDGGYSARRSHHAGSESLLAISLHFADMISSRGLNETVAMSVESIRDAIPS